MQTNRRTLFSCRSVVFAVAIFGVSTDTTTAAEIIPVSLIRPPLGFHLHPAFKVNCSVGQRRFCYARYSQCVDMGPGRC
jgi:hypothetical protein